MLMLLQVHLLPFWCFRSYIFTHQLICLQPLFILHRRIESNQTLLLLHDWLLQLVLPHKGSISPSLPMFELVISLGRSCTEWASLSVLCAPFYMGLVGVRCSSIFIRVCIRARPHQHPASRAAILTNIPSINQCDRQDWVRSNLRSVNKIISCILQCVCIASLTEPQRGCFPLQ